MGCVFLTKTAILFVLNPVWMQPFIFSCVVIPLVAIYAFKSNLIPHPYSITSVTTPAPTVCPPSRMANRSSLSIAIGIINSI